MTEKRVQEQGVDHSLVRRVLRSRPSGVLGNDHTQVNDAHRHQHDMAHIAPGIIFPWQTSYKVWWSLTVIGALLTGVFGPYYIAFFDDNAATLGVHVLENCFTTIFLVDIFVNFNLAFYQNEVMVFERSKIAQAYCFKSGMFWIDLIGVIPLDTIALSIVAAPASSPFIGDKDIYHQAQLLSLLRLFRLVRLHRLKPLSDVMQYNPRISLIAFTLLRNFAVALFVTHFSACCMYFLARLHDFGDDTWLGPLLAEHDNNLSGYERYMVSLHWSVVTFVTVGYGDFAPANSVEMTWGCIFMFFSIVVNSWIIGSITLLVVKGDEKTGQYRDALQTLNQYATLHDFDATLQQTLSKQLRLEFSNREIADEVVLKNFPSAMRRKVLRRLYLEPLRQTSLMRGVRPQFVDAFLSACSVEIFSPGEEMVERGSISSDLFLLVGGIAEITTSDSDSDSNNNSNNNGTLKELSSSTIAEEDEEEEEEEEVVESETTKLVSDLAESSTRQPIKKTGRNSSRSTGSHHHPQRPQIEAGTFVGEIGFFTESPQIDSVACLTVCKTLTMSQSSYQLIAQAHPGSVGKILQNLLEKVDDTQKQPHGGGRRQVSLPKSLTVLRAGSMFDPESSYGAFEDEWKREENVRRSIQEQSQSSAVYDLIQMHLSKQKDDQTTRLLFAASRGDLHTIRLMCDQNFDSNNADYDNRTALMVASMKGNAEVVKLLLLEYNANPNLTDVHGSSALYEAVKNGHESVMDLLLDNGAKLCMNESLAASVLCQAVHDGDILFLRRLLRARIPVDAADYDKRTAAHIAAAEGNVVALQVLKDFGADLTLQDRWNNTVDHEAQREAAAKSSGQMLGYLKTLKR